MSTKQRLACLHDLNNYFKKKDLLSGLTELEQARLRLNIGILDSSTDDSLISRVNFSTFNEFRTKGQLTPGKKYIITDFQSIYSSNVLINNVAISWGIDSSENPSTTYELLVTALTSSQIDKRATILNVGVNWEVSYDATQEILQDGVLTKGKITKLKDENNNECCYDFKNIKTRVYKSQLKSLITTSYVDLFTFSELIGNVASDSSSLSSVHDNKLGPDAVDNVFIGDTYNNILYNDCSGNLFIKGCHDCTYTWNTVNNSFEEEVCYLTGSLANKTILQGNIELSSAISKTVHKVNEATIVSYLDPITYSYQIIKL